MAKAKILRRLASIGILLISVAVAVVLVKTKSKPEVTAETLNGRLVQTFRATPSSHRMAIKAYGTSRAANQWTAIAEVGGRITSVEKSFNEGEVLQAETLLATIDKIDYEIAVKSAQTEINRQQQILLELAQSKVNIASVIALREQQVTLAKNELDRLSDLLDNGATSQDAYDKGMSTYIERQAVVNDLSNQFKLIPIQEQAAAIAQEAANLGLQQAERDLARCEIKLPFTALCISRNLELHQYAARSEKLGTFLALDRAEIVSMVEARRAMALLPKLGDTLGPIDLRSQKTSLIDEIRRRFDLLQIPVDVTWRAGEDEVQWRGKLARASATIDQATRAIPLIIEVDDAFTAVKIGERPAMVPGMFVELVIYGDTLDDVYVVPRDAVRNGAVYIVRDGRLAIVPVHVAGLEDSTAVIDSGLQGGDQVVIADLFPAANGMLLRSEEVANPTQPRTELPALNSLN